MNPSKEIVWVNDNYLNANRATISIFDRGLTFADAVYEVFLLHNGRVFDFKGHYQRLVRSLNLVKISNPTSEKKLSAIIDCLIEKNDSKTGDYAIYLQISRGNQKPRNLIYSDQLDANSCNQFIYLYPIQVHRTIQSVKVALKEDIRWKLATIKTNNLLANSYLLSDAHKKNGYQEVILHQDSLITEATSSNIFLVKDGKIHTPKLNNTILPGTTRKQIIINIAEKLGIEVIERAINVEEISKKSQLEKISEIWLCSSTKLVWAVNEIEGVKITHSNHPKNYPIGQAVLTELLNQIDHKQ